MRQMNLTFEPGLTQRFRSVKEVMATGVYQRGLTTVAGRLDMAPSKLSEKLNGGTDRRRDIGLEEFEAYLAQTGDLTPIHYLIEKFLGDPEVQQREAVAKLAALFESALPLLEAAGLGQGTKRGK